MKKILNTEKFLTAQQCAVRLGISGPSVQKLLNKRKLPYFRYGKCYKIPASAVDEFMKENYHEKK